MSTMQQYYGTVRYTAVTFRRILVTKGKNGKNLNKKNEIHQHGTTLLKNYNSICLDVLGVLL